MPIQMASGSLWDRFWLAKWVPNRGPKGIRRRFPMYISNRSKKRRFLQVFPCLINIAKMQSDCENTCAFDDFHFVTLVAFLYHLSSRRLRKTFKNRCPRRPKTIPKRSSILVACWIRFHNGFGKILDSQIASQRRSLRRPRGLQKCIFFSLASQEASRMDFGGHLNPLGLDFEELLE